MFRAALAPYTFWLRLAGYGLLIAIGFTGGYKWQSGAMADLRLDISKAATAAADAKAEASEAARREEASRAEAVHYIGQAYERGKTDAQSKADAVAADLRADNLRLRKHWRGCVSTSTAAAGQPDAGAELRAAGAGDLVRVVAACEAQVRGLQAVIAEMSK